MNEQTLLQHQIDKFIPIELQKNSAFIKFSAKVNKTYHKLNKAIEQEKKSNETNRKLVLDSALNVVILFDAVGKIISWNKRAITLFGKTEEEVIGKKVYETVFSESHSIMCRSNINNYIEKGDTSNMFRQIGCVAVNKENKEFPIEIAITPILQNKKLIFYLFVKDISEVKKANDFSINQEEKYRNIISNINIGIIEVGNDGLIQFANQTFAVISGFEIKELIGKNPNDLFATEESTTIIESKKKIREIGISDTYQLEVKNKKGEIRWWFISGAPNYDSNGNIAGSVGLHLDITNQKLLEFELEKEKVKAEVSAKAKELFLINMSHEIRTPLNAIVGFLRELKREELTENQKLFVNNSSLASYHLMAIINDVLDLSKIEAKEILLENKKFNFKSKITNVISVLQIKAKEKNLNLNLFISKEINPVLKGDILRIEQIIYNIVGNSLKFTHRGSVSIRCEVLEDLPKSQDICITISDTGIGMSPDFISNIFQIFTQESNAIARKFGGTGLGMSIAYQLAQLMNGKIEIESQKNQGTSVKIYLKLRKANNNNINININNNIDLQNISILLIEDNAINRLVAQKSLGNYHCKITEVNNGVEAVEILKIQKFDIILMDIFMPEMDGLEATEIIRNELKITTPIVAFTANAFKSEIEKFIEIGMDDYVLKPFDENILIETIAKHTIDKVDFTKV
jgi:PAS domain S-box-containing protein